ncbi:MAG: precorrin-6y C5,15-methyltransferase (decarboxylating) subunit CbiE [Parvularculales bacterium]
MTENKKEEPWLRLVGIGDDGIRGLGEDAHRALDSADIIAGGRRHLALIGESAHKRLVWPAGGSDAFIEALVDVEGQQVCVLASGDPMLFGIGVVLVRRFGIESLRIYPAPSSFSLAAARLGWPLQEVNAVSVHGRPLALLQTHIHPRARLLILSTNGTTPANVAALLCARGFGKSMMTVLEHLGGAQERIRCVQVNEFNLNECADLNLLAIECRGSPDAVVLPMTTGLPDDVFVHDGQLTKRETRAATLAALAPFPGARLWDIGAGCGSIAIEWMRCSPHNHAVALEPQDARRELIERNAQALGTPELNIVEGRAPEALTKARRHFLPDAIFVGGGAKEAGVLEQCQEFLPYGGRLVANVVTLEGERSLLDFHKSFGGELVRLSVARMVPVGSLKGWRSLMPVTQLIYVKC